MQISVENSSVLERRLTVEVPEERIATETQTRLESLCKSARVDGFRQGKVPMRVVRQRFGKRVRDEIVGEILQSTFGEAMNQEALRPAGQPVIDPVMSEPGAGLKYTATFEVFPEFELAAPEQLQLTRVTCEIGDGDIDTMIEKLRDQHKEWVAVERPGVDGDRLEINFTGTVDGEVFEGGSGEDVNLVLGSGTMIEGFDSGLLGKSAGDSVELNLTFPQEYRNTELAGKDVIFAVEVKLVTNPVLPEIDEAFIDKFGVSGGDKEAFRAEVRANMEKERERLVRQRFNSEVMDKVAAANDFEVPSILVQGELDRLRQQVARELIMRGINPGDTGQDFESTVRERAKNRVKLGLIMAEIIKRGELRADPDNVRQMIESMASSYEDSDSVMKWYYDNPEQMQQVEALCLEDLAVNWIADKAQQTDVPIAFDALMNPVQTDPQLEASS